MGAGQIAARKSFYHFIKPKHRGAAETLPDQHDDFYYFDLLDWSGATNSQFINDSVTRVFEGDYFTCVRAPYGIFGLTVAFNDDKRIVYPIEAGVEIEKRFDRFTAYRHPLRSGSDTVTPGRISDRLVVFYASRNGPRYHLPAASLRRGTQEPVTYRRVVAVGATHPILGTAGATGIVNGQIINGEQLCPIRYGWRTLTLVNRGPGALEIRGDEVNQVNFPRLEPGDVLNLRAFDYQNNGSLQVSALFAPCTIDLINVT